MADDIHGKDGPNVARVKARAAVPAAASPQIIPAPGAGPRVIHHQRESYMTENGPRDRAATMDGFHAVRGADVFDLMERNAQRRGGAGSLTEGQKAAGRTYQALVEWLDSTGIKPSALGNLSGTCGGPGGGDHMLTVIAHARQLRHMQAAIGDGIALSPVNHRAHADRGRRAIPVRELVDRVCLVGWPLNKVLAYYGWGRGRRAVAEVKAALAAALDRMSDV